MNVLIAPDKFKGSLKASEVARAIGEGIQSSHPEFKIRKFPLADGGEGSAGIIAEVLGAEIHDVKVRDPLRRHITAPFYYSPSSKTAIIEMATASGYELLTVEERNPHLTSSHGTGDLIIAAAATGAEKIVLFVGGSATNDGSAGMLHALGFTFPAGSERIMPNGGNLIEVSSIIPPDFTLPKLIIAHDVTNPLLGESGATYVYGPQKGALEGDLSGLERGMSHFSKIVEVASGKSLSSIPGMGAAGGIALGLVGFYDAQLVRGFDLIADTVSLKRHIEWADQVISGEGRIDDQSREGKVVGEVVKLCNNLNKPLILFCGLNEGYETASKVICLEDHAVSTYESMNKTYPLLVKLASELVP